MMDLELAQLTLRNTHKPHRLCKDLAGDLWEFISYPYIEGDKVAIKIRVPGDPTSMITADALALDPEDQSCLCSEAGHDYYLTADYYRERHARLTECPAMLRWPGAPPNTIIQMLGFGRLWIVKLGCGCVREGLTNDDLKREQLYIGKAVQCGKHPEKPR